MKPFYLTDEAGIPATDQELMPEKQDDNDFESFGRFYGPLSPGLEHEPQCAASTGNMSAGTTNVLICFLCFVCIQCSTAAVAGFEDEILASKVVTSTIDGRRVNGRNLVRAAEKRCPPGLWCGKKRQHPEPESITRENVAVMNDRSMSKQCPPGLWCGKKRELADQKSINKKNTLERNILGVIRGRCPPGLWCGKKRGYPEQESITQEIGSDSNDGSMRKVFRRRCPPGLWCGRKRQRMIGQSHNDEFSSRQYTDSS